MRYLWTKIKNIFVAKESGKGLSSNDFTAAYKSKLDGIANNANNYSLPTASSSTLGGIKVGSGLSISNGVLSASGGGIKIQAVSGDIRYSYQRPTITVNLPFKSALIISASDSAIALPGNSINWSYYNNDDYRTYLTINFSSDGTKLTYVVDDSPSGTESFTIYCIA